MSVSRLFLMSRSNIFRKLVAANISTKSSMIHEIRSWIVLPAKSLNMPLNNLLVLGIKHCTAIMPLQ